MALRFGKLLLLYVSLPLILGSLWQGFVIAGKVSAQGGGITAQQATNDTANVYYQMSVTGSYSYFRVYLDTDQSVATGFAANGIGANYLLENGGLYAYSGTGTEWSWQFRKNVTFSNANGLVKWSVARVDIGESATPNRADLIFQVEQPPTIISGAKYTHVYSAAAAATKTVAYSPTTALFPNPERGFYRYFDSRASAPNLWSQAQLRSTNAITWLIAAEQGTITQIYCLFYLDTFLRSDISSAYLQHIRANLAAIRSAGRKCILRFAYTWDDTDVLGGKDEDGNDIGDDIPDILQDASRDTEPDLPRLLVHIGQLKPILQEYADVIAVLQAGFIGIWGEWYYTDHFVDNPAIPEVISVAQYSRRKQVAQALLDALPASRMVALRYPLLKKEMFGRSIPIRAGEAFTNTPLARLAFHNDAFLNSFQDSGTFQSDADRTYLQAESLYLSMGGEINAPYGNVPSRNCADAIREMGKYHWSYINTDYYIPALESWKSNGCIHNTSAITSSILDRLGYRFVLKRGIYPTSAKPGGKLSIRIELTNDGFAAPYNKRSVYLVLRNTTTATTSYSALLPDDPRRWLAGTQTHILSRTITLPVTLPVGNYALYLHLADPAANLRNQPAYAIRLANASMWTVAGWNGMNNLRHTLQVRNSAARSADAPPLADDGPDELIPVEWEEIELAWPEGEEMEPVSPEEDTPEEGQSDPAASHLLYLPVVSQK